MNERLKVLQLLQDGKITVEEANSLLAALDGTDTSNTRKKTLMWDKATNDLKSFTSQMSSVVSQTLNEVKRGIESQFDTWIFGETITAAVEKELSDSVQSITIEAINGKIHAESWDKPYVRIHIRAEVKTDQLTKAKNILEDILDVTETSSHYVLRLQNSGGRNGVASASIDLFLPNHLHTVILRSKNGGLQASHLHVAELDMETQNGAISTSDVYAEKLRLTTNNGRIDVRNCVQSTCKNVYIVSKNGTVIVDGIHPGVHCIGTAKTLMGYIDISNSEFEVNFQDTLKRTHATFRTIGTDKSEVAYTEDGHPATDAHSEHETNANYTPIVTEIYCETKNGRVSIRT